jgi:trigger factor
MSSEAPGLSVAVETAGPCTRVLSITVPPERVDKEIEDTFKNVLQHVQFPGFRTGKAPRRLVEAKLGDRVLAEVKDRLVRTAADEAIKQEDIEPVGETQLDFEEIELAKGKELAFSVRLDVKPEFDLPELSAVKVERPGLAVSEEDVDGEIERLRYEQASVADGEEGDTIGEHDVAELEVTLSCEDDKIVDAEPLQWSPPSNLLGGMKIEGFSDALSGQAAGHEATFTVQLPDDFREETQRGKDAEVLVKVTKIQKVTLPEVDDAFVEAMDYDDLDEMRGDVRKQLERRLEAEADRRLDDAILDALRAATPFHVPPSLVKSEQVRVLRRFEMNLRQEGLPEEAIVERVLEAKEEAEGMVTRNLQGSFILERIAADRKVLVTENEVAQELMTMASRYNRTAAEMQEYVERNGLLQALRGSLKERKTLRELRDVLDIVDAAPQEASTEAAPGGDDAAAPAGSGEESGSDDA